MKEKINLPDVTIVCVDTRNYSEAFLAMKICLEHVTPARTIFFTDITYPAGEQIEVINIRHLFSKKDYSHFMMKKLGTYDIQTSHILVVQHDGYILDSDRWDDRFLETDYLGALWPESDGYSNGNGGFSLRSMKLHRALAQDELIYGIQPEDVGIARIYRHYLEQKHGIVFGSDELCNRFSYELIEPADRTFGHHGKFHPPYRETIVIKRVAALGDLVQVEPVLEWFHLNGFRVVLDTLPQFYALFVSHHYAVEDYQKFDKRVKHRVINLDLSYEVMPQQLHLKSYFEAAGISGYKVRNPRLNFSGQNRLFNNYVLIHIDERDTVTRNIAGVDWVQVRNFLEKKGYLVIQIGRNTSDEAGIRFNTVNEAMLFWLIAGASLMIAVDSGPSNVAVALGIKSVIAFGSVNPAFIYSDFSRIIPLQSECPAKLDGCWHHVIGGTRGKDCVVDKEHPPCCLVSTVKMIEGIKKAIAL